MLHPTWLGNYLDLLCLIHVREVSLRQVRELE